MAASPTSIYTLLSTLRELASMSCFGMASGSSAGWPLSPSPSSRRRRRGMSVKPWRLWWRRCAGVAAVIHSKIRRRAVRWPGGHGGGRRRREAATASSMREREREGWCHHRSFAPVYVDELYSHPKTHHVAVHEAQAQAQQPNTTAAKTNAGASGKARAVAAAANNADAAATNASATFVAKNAAADAATNAAGARAGKGRTKAAAAAAAATNNGGAKAARGGGVRSLLMSPLRGGACGMGEVDVRAEVFIRKFREEMRLQNQKSAEEFQAMLARGL